MSNRIHLSEITEQQRTLLQNAAARAMNAKSVWEREDLAYKELLGMAMPSGASGFDPQTGSFYREDLPEGLRLVKDEDLADDLNPATDYGGSPDNARVEGRQIDPLSDDDES